MKLNLKTGSLPPADIAIIAFLALFTGLVGWLGWRLIPRLQIALEDGNVDDINKLLLAVAGVVGVYFLVWRTWIADRQRHIAQEEHYTSLLTKAVEQLGATREEKTEEGGKTVPTTEVRLGGIYALEKLARDYSPLRRQITEILCAYVRKNARRPKPTTNEINKILNMDPHDRSAEDAELIKQHEEKFAPSIDVQAALAVIGRPIGHQHQEAKHDELRCKDRLDLRKAHLAEIELLELQFDQANFSGSCLDLGILTGVRLQKADLSEASLNGACLDGARLQNACLEDAQLQHASLNSAYLENAVLNRANLEGARLEQASLIGAQLLDARLSRAHLKGVVLRDANLRGAMLANAHLKDANLSGANLEGAQLFDSNFDGANLSRANLKNANLQGAKLGSANGLTQAQLDSARGDKETTIPEGFVRPEHWGKEPLGYFSPDSV